MTCVVHVYVRVGLERHDDVGQSTHPAADIRMWVKRDGNWDCFAHHASNARRQLTLAIFTEIKVHRAMQPEQKSVE